MRPPSNPMNQPQAPVQTEANQTRAGVLAPLLGLLMALILIGAAYSLSWSGTANFDDHPNLRGLLEIHDGVSAAAFIFSGQAGPLGRPVSLATFALQAESWPEPRPFLIVNTVIHLLNGVLVFWLALLLARLTMPHSARAGWFALAVAACWAASPFLASSSLMIVQRMTTLTASFVFLGLIAYIHGRLWMLHSPRRGTAFAIGSLCLFTMLAALSKENGILLPLLALVVEFIVLRRSPVQIPALARPAQGIFLYLPTFAILSYLAYRGFSAQDFGLRDFDLNERLLTQSRVLWDYLVNLLLPRASSSTLFTDDFIVSSGLLTPFSTLPAVLGLMAACLIAWLVRRRWPFLSFGLAFFLAAHLLESSTLPLEIYFAHRNYIPAFGVFFAVLFPLFFLAPSKAIEKLFAAGVFAYAALCLVVLVTATSLWGNPRMAAEIWSMERQQSVRALQNLSRIYAEEGDLGTARHLLNLGLGIQPTNALLALQGLGLCPATRDEYLADIERALDILRQAPRISAEAAAWMQQLAGYANRQICPGWTRETAEALLDAIEQHKDFSLQPIVQARVYLARSEMAVQVEDWAAAAAWVRKSQIAGNDPGRYAMLAYIAQRSGSAADLAQARQELDQHCRKNLRQWAACLNLKRQWPAGLD